MEKKITDLLDYIQDDTVQLRPKDNASVEDIKEATMRKINNSNNTVKKRRFKFFGKVAVAAIIVLALPATALATNIFGVGDYFASFFGTLTDSQIAVLEDIGTTDMPAAESNGTTITPLAAIGDEDFYYLMLHIEAPKGTVLGKPDGYYQITDPDGPPLLTFDSGEYKTQGYQTDLTWQDDDTSDNVITLVVRITAQYGADLKFNDGKSKTLCINGLWVQSPDKTYTKVLDGVWKFDIGLYGASGSKMLDVDGKESIGDGGYKLNVKSMDVSPLSIGYSYTFDYIENVTPGPGKFYAVMKDGTQIDITMTDGKCTETKTEGHGYFSSPINVSEVDHIQFGDLVIPVE